MGQGVLEKSAAYQAYLAGSRVDLQLPDLDIRNNEVATLFAGERFCRVAGCPTHTCFASTNGLHHHFKLVHKDITLTSKEKGGRATTAEIAEALTFFEGIIVKWEERHRNDQPNLPSLPLKINSTLMKKEVRNQDFTIPCVCCKLKNLSSACCSDQSSAYCDHFELFSDPREVPR
ncbi:uncharacterized protein N7482_010750 [Penicillium canariense]|uniref:Uncharacterized protein n=1 Tax=Penicillium canariense TaxID=189055 RepID=A0A9W9HMK9_9EURO|nr:uncharacterized protein N7482_010750 [Penicillium canariense]KAJ5151498.1 hypothetical protein N7482_010750 [Penicillium canariense]